MAFSNQHASGTTHGFDALLVPLIILSLVWKRKTKAGAIDGMIVGAVAIFVVKNYITIKG